jgi:hypothetical protein
MIEVLAALGSETDWQAIFGGDTCLNDEGIWKVYQVLLQHALLGPITPSLDSGLVEIVKVLKEVGRFAAAMDILCRALIDFERSFGKPDLWVQLGESFVALEENRNFTHLALLAIRFNMGSVLGENQGESGLNDEFARISSSTESASVIVPNSMTTLFVERLKAAEPRVLPITSERSRDSILRIFHLLSKENRTSRTILDAVAEKIFNDLKPDGGPYARNAGNRLIMEAATILRQIGCNKTACELLAAQLSQEVMDATRRTSTLRTYLQEMASGRDFLPPSSAANLIALRFDLEDCVWPEGESIKPANPRAGMAEDRDFAITAKPFRQWAWSMVEVCMDVFPSGERSVFEPLSEASATGLLKIAALPTYDCDIRKAIPLLARARLARYLKPHVGEVLPFAGQRVPANALNRLYNDGAALALADQEKRKTTAWELLEAAGCVPKFHGGFIFSNTEPLACDLPNFKTKQHAQALMEFIRTSCQLGKMSGDEASSLLRALIPHARICTSSTLFSLFLEVGSVHPDLFSRKEFRASIKALIDDSSKVQTLLDILKEKFLLAFNSFRHPYSPPAQLKQCWKTIAPLASLLFEHDEIFRRHWTSADAFAKHIQMMKPVWETISRLLQGSLCIPVTKSFSLICEFEREIKHVGIDIADLLEVMRAVNASDVQPMQVRVEMIALGCAGLRGKALDLSDRIELLNNLKPFVVGPQNIDVVRACPRPMIFFLAAHARMLAALPLALTDELSPLATALQSVALPASAEKAHAQTYVGRLATVLLKWNLIPSKHLPESVSGEAVQHCLYHLHSLASQLGDIATASTIAKADAIWTPVRHLDEQTRIRSLQFQL